RLPHRSDGRPAELRDRDRPLRGPHRTGARPLRQLLLAPSDRELPVVTTTESLTAGPDLSGVRASTRGIKPTPSYRVFTAINIVVLCLVGAITLYPFLNLLARSFSSESAIRGGEVF